MQHVDGACVPLDLAVSADRSTPEESFDRQVLGRLVLHILVEIKTGVLPHSQDFGLDEPLYRELLAFLHLDHLQHSTGSDPEAPEADEEELMLRGLLLQHTSEGDRIGVWLAGIIAHRSLKDNHLWEDLGLAERSDLRRLLEQHYYSLASKNTRNMRWKRFLYRSLCEAEGFTMCPSPTCDSCSEFTVCYGDESGEAVLARNARAARLGLQEDIAH
ncbi:nitrogen fixation protein NifQ [Beijerinckia indica]|uniref:NifQ family protein n=1 Tax=Beijerinckia indica subsp. indica (strain ATCC 9039 / DSM 1715 / NCIMB 8712) TaxID=395963 RepID=B2IEU1_BEII9|nr:nitrogen fixation protein NifQ [Beijerinckia indica]ACB94135.1 NifQ family protein [Beijerinckia indica subsp. indica ATCC 9039]